MKGRAARSCDGDMGHGLICVIRFFSALENDADLQRNPPYLRENADKVVSAGKVCIFSSDRNRKRSDSIDNEQDTASRGFFRGLCRCDVKRKN